MKKLIFATLVLSLPACIIRPTPPTRDKFIVMAGIYDILVKKVHAPQWRIGYNFVFGCAGAFKPQEKELKAAMTKSLRVWLQPLRELYPDKVFTDDFLFVRQPDMKACYDNREARRQVDTRITFTCQVATSGALIGGITPRMYACDKVLPSTEVFYILSSTNWGMRLGCMIPTRAV